VAFALLLGASIAKYRIQRVTFQIVLVFVYRFGLRCPTAQVDGLLSWLVQLSEYDCLAIWYHKDYAEVGLKFAVTDELTWKGLGARGCFPTR